MSISCVSHKICYDKNVGPLTNKRTDRQCKYISKLQTERLQMQSEREYPSIVGKQQNPICFPSIIYTIVCG